MSASRSEDQYLDLMRRVLQDGDTRDDRTGTGTISVFGANLEFDLQDGFPLLTTKRVHWRSVCEEMLWMLRGETNVRSLQQRGVSIWDEWADDEGDLGQVYGAQWRDWGGMDYDQIHDLIRGLCESPNSRRHIVSAWNVSALRSMALPPCHLLFQCYVSKNGGLSLQMYQRSADVFLGLPFNIAGYALLTHLLAYHTGYWPDRLLITIGDAHLYLNHVEQAREQISREPRAFPKLVINDNSTNIDGWYFEDFELVGYDPHPTIPAEVSK